jgi:putative membrane protein
MTDTPPGTRHQPVSQENEGQQSVTSTPPYRPKVIQQSLDITPPEIRMPAKVEGDTWLNTTPNNGLSLGAATLGFGVFSLIGFFIFDAYTTLSASFASHPIGSGVLATLLCGFVASFSYLSFLEWKGYKQVNKALEQATRIASLDAQSDVKTVDSVLNKHGKQFSSQSYAAHCYRQFSAQVQPDMTAKERLGLYQDTVINPVQTKAQQLLNKESLTAGSLAFISPNNLIQTFAVVWVSFRTIRRMANVYGLRPGTLGNWSLMKVLAQNIAAQGIFDLATDEVANQIGGSLSAKFMENSAEAIAAGALNMRLGKALMKLLK